MLKVGTYSAVNHLASAQRSGPPKKVLEIGPKVLAPDADTCIVRPRAGQRGRSPRVKETHKMSNETVNTEAVSDDDDEDVSALVADATAEETDASEDVVIDDDNEEADEEAEDSFSLDKLPEHVRGFFELMVLPKLNDAIERFKKQDEVISASVNRDNAIALRFKDGTEDYVVEARERYDALHKEADELRTATEERIRSNMADSATPEQLAEADTLRKAAKSDYDANVKYITEQVLTVPPFSYSEEEVSEFLPKLPKATSTKTGSKEGTGNAGPRPRVNEIYWTVDGKREKVIQAITKNNKPVYLSNFTALRQKLEPLTEGTVTVDDLYAKWFAAAGEGIDDWQKVKTDVSFVWDSKKGPITIEVMYKRPAA